MIPQKSLDGHESIKMWNKDFSFSRVNELVACRHVGALNLSSVPYICWYRGPQILNVSRKDSFRNLLASNLAIFEVVCRAKIYFFYFSNICKHATRMLKTEKSISSFCRRKNRIWGTCRMAVQFDFRSNNKETSYRIKLQLTPLFYYSKDVVMAFSWYCSYTLDLSWYKHIYTLHFQHHFRSVKSVRLMPL